MAPHELSHQMDNNIMHECNLVLRPQNNMNVSPDCSNFRNQIGNVHHDVNVNHLQSPLRSSSKFSSTP